MEPPDDGCVGSFVVAPNASINFNIPFTSKKKGQKNDSKGKKPAKAKGKRRCCHEGHWKGKKSAKAKGKKRCCHEGHWKFLWRLNCFKT